MANGTCKYFLNAKAVENPQELVLDSADTELSRCLHSRKVQFCCNITLRFQNADSEYYWKVRLLALATIFRHPSLFPLDFGEKINVAFANTMQQNLFVFFAFPA